MTIVDTVESAERGYNNRAAVPEHAQWFARMGALSDAARASLGPELDVRYGPSPKQTLDIFLPHDTPKSSFVFIHGGYWRSFDKDDFAFVAPVFVDQGIAVAVINYDLCPAVSIATIADECRQAVAWVIRHGPAHGLDATRIVVGGHSAGGQQVAMLFATDWADFGLARNPLAAGVTLSGVHDLAPLVLTSINADLKLDAAEAVRQSPVHLRPSTGAPLLMAVGADETSEFVRQTWILWDAWPGNRPEGAREPLIVPGRHHFSVVVDYADPDSDLTRQTLAQF
jgi:arylformamidase